MDKLQRQAECEYSYAEEYSGTQSALLHVCTILEEHTNMLERLRIASLLSAKLSTPTSEHARYAREEQSVYTRYIGYLQ